MTVQLDRLTSEQYEEDDVSGIIELIEVIRIQSSGPTEAARGIRKKLQVAAASTISLAILADAVTGNMATHIDNSVLLSFSMA